MGNSFALLASAALSTLTVTTAAEAAVMTYTIAGTGTGTLGAKSFTDADYVITATGDPTTIDKYGRLALTSTVISIAGQGDAVLSGATAIQPLYSSLFLKVDGMDYLSVRFASSFSLNKAFSPMTSQSVAFIQGGTTGLATSLGTLAFSSTSAIQGASAIAAVPEPATWAMMLVGFGMVGAAARVRRRSLVVRYG